MGAEKLPIPNTVTASHDVTQDGRLGEKKIDKGTERIFDAAGFAFSRQRVRYKTAQGVPAFSGWYSMRRSPGAACAGAACCSSQGNQRTQCKETLYEYVPLILVCGTEYRGAEVVSSAPLHPLL